MCLEKAKGPFKAKKTIECYVIRRPQYIGGKIVPVSPYWGTRNKVRKIMTAKGTTSNISREAGYISGGYFHSFKYITAGKRERNDSKVVYLATIPKGSIYYTGLQFDCKGYASRKLTLKKIVCKKRLS